MHGPWYQLGRSLSCCRRGVAQTVEGEEEEEPNDHCVTERANEVKRKWSYVGKGHGNYERILTYSYVGEGSGTFNKETTTSYYGCRPRLCCIILSMVLTIACGAYIYLGPEPFIAVGRWLITEVEQQILKPGLVPFDCASNSTDDSGADANASKIWSTFQHSWCCSQEHIGCGNATTSTTTTLHTAALQTSQRPHHLLHDCYVGYAEWKNSWSEAKQDWCCSHYMRGCHVITVPELAITTTTTAKILTHRTTSTLATTTTTTTVSITRTTTVRPAPTTTTNKGCETECEFQQRTETCGSRIRVGVKTQFLNKKNACTLAHSTVLLQCPACAACTLAAAGCAAPAAAAPGELSYDCNFGFSNWARAWSAAKKVWCCNHTGRGCGDAATRAEG